jgi:hypothetical protein
MLTLATLNQELLIPRIAQQLGLDRDDPGGVKDMQVRGGYEPNGIHIEGERGSRKDNVLIIKPFRCVIPESLANNLIHIIATEARYYPGEGPHQGKWELLGCTPLRVEPIPGILEAPDDGRYFLITRNIDFDALTRNPNWFQLASTWRLYEELQRSDSNRLASMAVLFHSRLTRPILGMVLVFLGLSVILRDQNRNVIIRSGHVRCGPHLRSKVGKRGLRSGTVDAGASSTNSSTRRLLFLQHQKGQQPHRQTENAKAHTEQPHMHPQFPSKKAILGWPSRSIAKHLHCDAER